MAKANHFNRMASSLADPKCPPSKWWNIARNMCGLKGHSFSIVPPLKGKDHTVLDDIDKDKNILNDTFVLRFWDSADFAGIREVLHSVRRNFLDGMLRSGCEFRKLIPKRSLKRSIETESERNSVDHFRKSHSLVQW